MTKHTSAGLDSATRHGSSKTFPPPPPSPYPSHVKYRSIASPRAKKRRGMKAIVSFQVSEKQHCHDEVHRWGWPRPQQAFCIFSFPKARINFRDVLLPVFAWKSQSFAVGDSSPQAPQSIPPG